MIHKYAIEFHNKRQNQAINACHRKAIMAEWRV